MKLFTSILIEERDGIIHNIPNKRYWKWEINALGFRGKAIELEKKEGQIRIVCLGGSETFGYYESKDKEWPSQLGKMLQDKFSRAEVINASVVGLQIRHRKEYVKKYILPLKPDILILYHHRFMIFLRGEIRGMTDEKGGKTDTGKRTRGPAGLLRAHIRYLFGHERIGRLYLPGRLIKRIALRKLRRKIEKREKKFLAGKEPLDEAPQRIILAYEKELRSFCDYLKEHNIIPVLSTYPTLATASDKDNYEFELSGIRRYCVELSETGIRSGFKKLNEMIRTIAGEQHLIFIDNDHLIPKNKKHFTEYIHYTNKGAEVIARNFYEMLEHSGLLR
jgi:lysophospholipase L1-like esterase